MKFFHLSDLHIGKRLFEFSLLEDQEYILDQILALARENTPDAFLLAGDIYDKPSPSGEAVVLFDRFLTDLSALDRPIFIISGNHDSADRLSFGSRLLQHSKVYLAPPFNGDVTCIPLEDEYGMVDVYLLPFIKPGMVREFYPDRLISSYQDAVSAALSNVKPDPNHRNILVAHQFVTGAKLAESEELSVGGVEEIDAALFSEFDYVALGHIHREQQVNRPTIRYCGTPLAYSFSEAGQQKSVTVVELREKGDVESKTLPLKPRREMRELRGSYDELTDQRNYEGTAVEDYLHIILTDEEDVPYAMGKLRTIYPNVMHLTYDNARTKALGEPLIGPSNARQDPLEMFDELYRLQNNAPLSDPQRKILQGLIEDIWREK